MSLKWNFVYPFSGGSGPLGFYVSFLFIAGSFIAATFFAGLGWWQKKRRAGCLAIILMIGLSYNMVLAEESAVESV